MCGIVHNRTYISPSYVYELSLCRDMPTYSSSVARCIREKSIAKSSQYHGMWGYCTVSDTYDTADSVVTTS